MRPKALTESKWFRPAMGAALTVLCGLVLWGTPIGDSWVNASYDYLFWFGARAPTNQVVLVLMDKEASDYYRQLPDQPWDRALHAKLLNRLADDGCALVVFDCLFFKTNNPDSDRAFAEAMRRQGRVLLAADQSGATLPGLASARPSLPADFFLAAASNNWGVAWLDPELDAIVRRHWPNPSPGPYDSLPWAAARLAGARLDESAQERWLRYYGRDGAWPNISFHLAFGKTNGFFRNKTVFVGFKPRTPLPGDERDEFRTPYTRWTAESNGGVEILAASYLNLLNGDWLRRPNGMAEGLAFILTGILLGGGLCRLRPLHALGLGIAAALLFTCAGIWLSYFTNFWTPWLVVVGAQVPCAMAWALAPALRAARPVPDAAPEPATAPAQASAGTIVLKFPEPELPDTPEYELFQPPIGEGGYGRVWLAKNAIGQWQALKAIYQAKFGANTQPYEAEFKGLQRYKPISEMHPGLLRVDLVSRQKGAGYFYYVMELADALAPGWEANPTAYKPRDLENVRKQSAGRRLPALECVRIGTILAEALAFLHKQGLTHRDIKPSNVIFVHGRPKLADVGLVTNIRPADQVNTLVGTPGYMPPPPEVPGTAQADIYALGMVLYVISTGRDPCLVTGLSTSLIEESGGFAHLNPIVLKACRPDCAQRYQSASELHKDLLEAQKALDPVLPTGRI